MPVLAASHPTWTLETTSRGCTVTARSVPSRSNFHTSDRRAGSRGKLDWMRPRRRDAGDVRALRSARDHLVTALSTALARYRGELRSSAGAAEPIAQAGVRHGGTVRHGFVRYRVSGSVAACAVALPEFLDLA